jgi:hypothetical protein
LSCILGYRSGNHETRQIISLTVKVEAGASQMLQSHTVLRLASASVRCCPWRFATGQHYKAERAGEKRINSSRGSTFSEDSLLQSVLLVVRTLSIIRYSKKKRNTTFLQLGMLPSSGEGSLL